MSVLPGFGPLGPIFEGLAVYLQGLGPPYDPAVIWALLGAWVLHLAMSLGLALWFGYCLAAWAAAAARKRLPRRAPPT